MLDFLDKRCQGETLNDEQPVKRTTWQKEESNNREGRSGGQVILWVILWMHECGEWQTRFQSCINVCDWKIRFLRDFKVVIYAWIRIMNKCSMSDPS